VTIVSHWPLKVKNRGVGRLDGFDDQHRLLVQLAPRPGADYAEAPVAAQRVGAAVRTVGGSAGVPSFCSSL
jgi:hypothetical protein